MIPIVGGMALSQALGIGWLPFLLLGAGSYFLLTKVLHGNRSRLIPALTVLGVLLTRPPQWLRLLLSM
jgi:hypothetical protein